MRWRVNSIEACPECGACQWDSDGDCKACATAATIAWYAANAASFKKRRAPYNAAHYAKNADKIKTSRAEWSRANPGKTKEYRANWTAKNPDATRINKQNRRAREKRATGTMSKGLAQKLFALQRGKCACCKQPLGTDYHLDHIMPLALGGANVDTNIQLLRAQCNREKNAKHPVDFMQSRGFLI